MELLSVCMIAVTASVVVSGNDAQSVGKCQAHPRQGTCMSLAPRSYFDTETQQCQRTWFSCLGESLYRIDTGQLSGQLSR